MSSMPTEPLSDCFFGEGIHFIVDERAGDEAAELIVAVVVKFIFEELCPANLAGKCTCHVGNTGSHVTLADAEVDGLTVVILACPPREFAIIGRSAPFSGRWD